jgi:peptidoglycan/LPS O-acetylase OafA/YrhL
MTQLLRMLGIVLVLGGLAHSAGVVHLYVSSGIPDANRVLLDVWIAQAQLLGGGLYLAAFQARRAGTPSRASAVFGALTIIGFTVSIIPVLFARAPILFRVPALVYLLLSVVIAADAARDRRSNPG